jgi:hypothetical protein
MRMIRALRPGLWEPEKERKLLMEPKPGSEH